MIAWWWLCMIPLAFIGGMAIEAMLVMSGRAWYGDGDSGGGAGVADCRHVCRGEEQAR